MSRGKERQVICASCKRYCRRDKAVYIDKVVFSNPIERKDMTEKEGYQAVFKRQVAYCPGCGKHLRIYEKKIQENERAKERAIEREARTPAFNDRYHNRSGSYKETSQPQQPLQQATTQAEETEEPTQRRTESEDVQQAA